MKLNNIIDIIEKNIPLSLAYEWDNPGLLIGDKEAEIKKALISLDVNLFTVKEAIENNVDVIISHHPMFFKGIKNINYSTVNGEIIKLLIENNISVYSAHTNMDIVKGGINDKLCELFCLSDIEELDQNGLGRTGFLKNKMIFSDFCRYVSKILNTPLRCGGKNDKIINKIAVGSGSCIDIAPIAISKKCDAFITSDVKYHEMLDYTEMGLNIVDAGHFPTEICVIDIFTDILSKCDIKIIKSKQKDIFNFII